MELLLRSPGGRAVSFLGLYLNSDDLDPELDFLVLKNDPTSMVCPHINWEISESYS